MYFRSSETSSSSSSSSSSGSSQGSESKNDSEEENEERLVDTEKEATQRGEVEGSASQRSEVTPPHDAQPPEEVESQQPICETPVTSKLHPDLVGTLIASTSTTTPRFIEKAADEGDEPNFVTPKNTDDIRYRIEKFGKLFLKKELRL